MAITKLIIQLGTWQVQNNLYEMVYGKYCGKKGIIRYGAWQQVSKKELYVKDPATHRTAHEVPRERYVFFVIIII